MPNSTPSADRLHTLNEIGRALSGKLDLHELYETIYRETSRVMDTSELFIALHRPEEGMVRVEYLRSSGELRPPADVPAEESVTGRVIALRTPVHFESITEYIEYGREHGLHHINISPHNPEAMLFVPLNIGDRTIGALSVQSMRPGAYSAVDMETLSVIASQAAVAIENARLYQESQENIVEMQALLEVARSVNSSLDLPTVLRAILSSIRTVVPYSFAGVFLPDASGDMLHLQGVAGQLDRDDLSRITIPNGKGIVGTAFESGSPVVVADVTTFPGYIHGGLTGILSEVGIPIRHRDTVVGILNMGRDERDAFSAHELDLLSFFASQAGIAIENARLYTAQDQRVHELQTIQSVVQALNPHHTIRAIAAVISNELDRLIEFNFCTIMTLDRERGMLFNVTPEGVASGLRCLRLGEGLSGWVAVHGVSQLVANAHADSRVIRAPGRQEGIESLISAPLLHDGRVQGVITLSKLGVNQFDENSLRLLEIIAGQAAIAFDRARLYQELRTEAITDPVTKLYNRRYLYERFKEERSRALRSRHPLAVIMLDIDKFKRVNDTYGHDAGDVVLEELARVIRGVVRTEDIVARHGGEEFCILLPNIPVADAEGVAERLREAIESHRLPKAAGVSHITVSVGLAFLGTQDTGQEPFARADQAMYRVKRLGGNRVIAHRDCEAPLRHGQQAL